MKYNRSEIMKAAWAKFRRFCLTFSQALHMAWYEAKRRVAHYNVYGESIHSDAVALLCADVTDAAAQDMNQYRDDTITIKAA